LENFGYLKKAAHGDMSRLGERGILVFKKHSTGKIKYTIPPCGMSSINLVFLKKKKKSYEGSPGCLAKNLNSL